MRAWLCTSSNQRRVVVFLWILWSGTIGRIERWGDKESSTPITHQNVPNFSHLVREWNTQFAWCTKGTTYDNTFFCDYVVADLVRNFMTSRRRKTLKRFKVQLDNVSSHHSRSSRECLEHFRALRMPHPAYSPDSAPSDFFLFGYLKSKL
jgi:hypothetical protein